MSSTVSAPPIGLVPKGRVALWILIAGEFVIFGGLIASYILYRLRFPEWSAQAAHTSTVLGAVNTVVLLTSSFTVVMAHSAALQKDTAKSARMILATILLAAVFLIIKGIEYSSEISAGMTLSSPTMRTTGHGIGSLFWSFYYLLTGLHALHVIAGMVALFVVMRGVQQGKHPHRVELAGMYWHMVDLIWIFLFPLLYIAK